MDRRAGAVHAVYVPVWVLFVGVPVVAAVVVAEFRRLQRESPLALYMVKRQPHISAGSHIPPRAQYSGRHGHWPGHRSTRMLSLWARASGVAWMIRVFGCRSPTSHAPSPRVDPPITVCCG